MSRCHQIWNWTIGTWNFNVLKSADFRCPILQLRSRNLLFFASQGFIISIPNPKDQRLPWDNFCIDPINDKPSWTFLIQLNQLNENSSPLEIKHRTFWSDTFDQVFHCVNIILHYKTEKLRNIHRCMEKYGWFSFRKVLTICSPSDREPL